LTTGSCRFAPICRASANWPKTRLEMSFPMLYLRRASPTVAVEVSAVPELLHEWLDVLAVALVVSPTSVTVTKARVFREVRTAAAWHPWLEELLHCPYCLSHWIALGLVLVYRPCVIRGPAPVVDTIVSLFVIVALASMWSRLICEALRSMDRLTDTNPTTPEEGKTP